MMNSKSVSWAALLALLVGAASGCDSSDPGPGWVCTTDVPADTKTSERASCAFGKGAMPTRTLGISERERATIPIKHIVVLMKENRSFDHLFGNLHAHQPNTEAIPASFTNLDVGGQTVSMTHATTTCISHDPDHQWDAMHAQVNNGAMDGFVTSAANSTGTDGHFVMSYYDETDLPFYNWLASKFAINDRHFASIRSGTFPNRNVLLLGTNAGVMATGAGYPPPGTPTIFDSLDDAGVSWGVYSDGSLLSGTLLWSHASPGTHYFADFMAAVDAGTLPAVSFVDGIDNVDDEHPTANVQQGETWTRAIYERIRANPTLWADTAILFTYDEGGGFADHVPPPNTSCPASDDPTDQSYEELGVRVPMMVVSPYARPGYVSHVVQDHSAITRFIETVFNLPALTGRDANSDALLDMFDFGCSPALLTPEKSPAAGTGGCYGACRLTADKPVYAPGEPIQITFANCPTTGATNWIGMYPYPATGPTLPHPGATLWKYTNDSRTAPTGPTVPANGMVTLDGSAIDAGPWPLTSGGYIVYYLLDGNYVTSASVDLNVSP